VGGGVFVPVDITRDDLERALEQAGHDATQPTAWVWEGVTMYLPPPAVVGTLQVVERRSAPRSRLALTYLDPGAVPLAPVVRAGFRAFFGEPLTSGYTPESMRALLRERGFEARFDESSRAWDRSLGGAPRWAGLVRAERLVVAHRS
jgi:methyltransferase (TIGR00027 family)